MQLSAHLERSPRREAIIAQDVRRVLAADLPWHLLDDATVVISGAAGFLASYLIEVLLALTPLRGTGPRRIVGVVRSREKALARFAAHAGRPELEFLVADVANPIVIAGPVDFVIHAASPASPRTYLTDPVGVLSANIDGTRHLLSLARQHGARFLLFSSGEVYGQTDVVPTSEEDYGSLDPMAVRSCYAESKRLAETMTSAWSHQFGLHASVVRPFHTYGPGIALDDGRVFADFVADIVHHRDIVMRSDGSDSRAFCYVADATAGFLTVLLTGAARMAYNIGNDRGEITIAALADRLVALYPERGLKVVRQPGPRSDTYAPSPIKRNAPAIDRARSLGWHPSTSIDEGFRRMVASYG